MKHTVNECVGCGFPCRRNCCRNYHVTRFYCDRCGDEATLYHFDDKELCIRCIEKSLDEVT